MNEKTMAAPSGDRRMVGIVFSLTLFLSALTGFAQMPIFKRYYIADLPGLGWLAQFYVTYTLHYISAIAFITVAAYVVANHWLIRRHRVRVSAAGAVRAAMLAWILLSGILLVFRNLPGYRYSPEVIVFLNFGHLGMVVLYLATAAVLRLMKKKWTSPLASGTRKES